MFTMKLETDNAAFVDGREDEVADLLSRVARLVRKGYLCGPLHDSNGNTCGSWDLDLPPERDEDDDDQDDDEDEL